MTLFYGLPQDVLTVGLCSFVWFLSVFYVSRRKLGGSTRKAAYVVSTTHCVMCVSSVAYYFARVCSASTCQSTSKNTRYENLVLGFSGGYFVADTWVTYLTDKDVEAIAHHVTIFIAILDSVRSLECGFLVCYSLILAESVTPWMNTFMSGILSGYPRAEFCVKALFAVQFLIVRGIWGPAVFLQLLRHPRASWTIKAVGIFITLLGFHWIRRVVREALAALRKSL